MKVKCVLCDDIHDLDDGNPLAKKLRNRPIHTYMCETCQARIAKRTEERAQTGNFHLYRDPTQDDGW
ncbi:YlaI family protein [Sinobaca sp. H24]|uniref:YlaI family protein n=1 Tax=Sinobaca sp. H24 TaxID=2923376 RepID=UPI0020797967|nr:YlaI family protein [Sinobaca sp. H24]